MQIAEVLSGRGDRQLFRCLEGVGSSDRPFGSIPVGVRVRSPNTSNLEGARADFSRQDGADRAFFDCVVVTAEDVDAYATEREANRTGNADVVVVGLADEPDTRIFDFVDREACAPGAAIVVVGDGVEARYVAERVGFAVDAVIPPAVEVTDLEAASSR